MVHSEKRDTDGEFLPIETLPEVPATWLPEDYLSGLEDVSALARYRREIKWFLTF